MTILYLTEQHAWVKREGECLIVCVPAETDGKGKPGGKERKVTVQLVKLEQVVILGDITLSTPAIAALLELKVPISYMDKFGNYLGNLAPATSKNSTLRLAQFEAHTNPNIRLVIARRFVGSKLRNMRTMLMRFNRTAADNEISNQIELLKRFIRAAEQSPLKLDEATEMGRMNGLGTLLGHEGGGSAAYFGVFNRLIKCNWEHGFTRRVRRPPTDPVNAMLSYGYSLLAAQVTSLLASVGFDPYIGYLHSSKYGKPALALDLMEEFRPLIVDSVVLNLLNNRQLEQSDFEVELNSYKLQTRAKKLFLQKFEERMQEVIMHPYLEKKASYRQAIEWQARLLGKFLTSEIAEYPVFTVR